ncbi:MAG: hypothetical protein VX893_06965 [Candidatus Latescibacterota bacterium]|nr:hypothetical protein [Candidatus Latescibacterota bacterium]
MSAEDNVNYRRLLLALLLTLFSLGGAWAEGPFFSKKFYGYTALGASGWLFSEAYAARQDANDAYGRYKRAETRGDVQIFYDESRRFDTRVVVMGALGVGALTWSVRLLRGEERKQLPPPPSLKIKGVDIDIGGDFLGRRVQMTLKKDF